MVFSLDISMCVQCSIRSTPQVEFDFSFSLHSALLLRSTGFFLAPHIHCLSLLLFFCFVRQMFEYAIKDIVIIITNFCCCCCWFMSTRNTLWLLSENEASELIRYTIESPYCENNDHENNESEGHSTF